MTKKDILPGCKGITLLNLIRESISQHEVLSDLIFSFFFAHFISFNMFNGWNIDEVSVLFHLQSIPSFWHVSYLLYCSYCCRCWWWWTERTILIMINGRFDRQVASYVLLVEVIQRSIFVGFQIDGHYYIAKKKKHFENCYKFDVCERRNYTPKASRIFHFDIFVSQVLFLSEIFWI